MALLRIVAAVVVICFVAAIGIIALAWRLPIEAVARPEPGSFAANLIKRGAELAAMGECNTCHTAPNGRPYAGGLGVPTPFGTIFSTNITPDDDTGIGLWSETAFRRALREGVSRDGHQLYPAFPYDHFTLLSDDDIGALYAFFMTRQAVHAVAPGNALPFPLNIRMVVAGWKLLFLHEGPYRTDAKQRDSWNRGAYLVEGVAHCGACHTPRNALGAERTHDAFGGGEAEGWTAYALNDASPVPVPWTAEALRAYLRNGWQGDHGVALGPMAPVTDDLAAAPDSDLAAMASYMAGVFGQPGAERQRAAQAIIDRVHRAPSGNAPEAADADGPGATIFRAVCATCHSGARPLPYGGINLALSTGPSAPDARNVINVVLWGLPPAAGERSPIMPGFANVLSDRQLADLLGYVRSRFSAKPAWTTIDKDIAAARTGQVEVSPAHGTDPAAATVSQHEAQP